MPIDTTTTLPEPEKLKSGRGLYMDNAAFDQVDAWISRPYFRSRGDVIAEMARVLSLAGWKPGHAVVLPKSKK